MGNPKRTTETKKQFNFVPIFLILVLIAFSLILVQPETLQRLWRSDQASDDIMKAQQTVLPTPTDLPERFGTLSREYFENAEQTNRIIYGGIVLVVIIFVGTGIFYWNENKHRNEK